MAPWLAFLVDCALPWIGCRGEVFRVLEVIELPDSAASTYLRYDGYTADSAV